MSIEATLPAEPEAIPPPPMALPPAPARKTRREVIYRHTFLVRLTHWLNALTIFIMIGSGLNIFDAHPHLYWGQRGSELDHPFLTIGALNTPSGPRGVVVVGNQRFDTTGFLGVSSDHGHLVTKAWPAWLTIPTTRDLASARHWHFFFAWVLVINGLAYLLWSLFKGHIQRDLWPTLGDLRSVPRSVLDHLLLRHPTGEAAKRYNVLQRFAYLGLIALVTTMALTGLTMSPGFDAYAPWLLDLFGGRQSARAIHFFCAMGIAAFIAVHLIEVVLAGPINEVWSMISGFYAVPRDHHPRKRQS